MKKCPKCKVEILDDTYICPLCLSVLEEVVETDQVNNNAIYPAALNIKKYHISHMSMSMFLI